MIAQTYLVPTQRVGGRLPMQRHGWHEYGNYIGIASAIALDLGVLWVLFGRRSAHHWFGLSLALTSIVLFLLSLGDYGPLAPATLSQHLPLFSHFRIPSRYTIVVLQFAALTLAWAFQSIVARHGLPARARAIVGLACLVAAAHLLLVNQWHFKGVFNQPPLDTTFRWMAGPREIATDSDTNAYIAGSPMLRSLVEHRAFFYCYESLQLYRAAAPERPLIFTEGTVRVSDVEFSPNRVTFSVFGGPEPSRVLLNYNWGPGWSTTAGPIELMGEPGKLATVRIAPGLTGRFEFSFTPPGLYLGIATCVVAAIASALLWRKRLRPIVEIPPPR
jgi:multisubunit Na+/H+ antiporter MnhC subunit